MNEYPHVSEGILGEETIEKTNTQIFLDIVGKYFPEAIKDGEVDFVALKEEMGEFNEVKSEQYDFTWAGKQAAKKDAQSDVFGKTLRFKPQDSVNPESTENLYIEGDNLEVLKLLRRNYRGAIKMIYIDPPYNTGSDFIYRDNFTMTEDELSELNGNVIDGIRYQKNLSDGARFHTKWLNNMYPRLKVAKDLLTNDGVIFIHIDDNEFENLTKIANQVFNEDNFINIITVKTKIGGVSGSSEGKSLKDATEFILVYCKNKNDVFFNPIYTKQKLFEKIEEYQREGKSWKYTSIITKLSGKEVIKRDDVHDIVYYGYKELETMSISAFASQNNISVEDVYNKYADKIFQTTNAQSSVRLTLMKETEKYDYPMYSCEYVPIKGKNEGNRIEILYKGEQRRMMMFLSDSVERIDNEYYYLEKITTLWDDIQYNNLTKEGDIEYSNGKKPIKLLQRIISLASSEDSIILDFFSGSASTAHAVMQLNSEENSNRKFIMVQLQENLDISLENADATTKKSIKSQIDFLDSINRPHFLNEIGKERIKRSASQIIENNPNAKFDFGFKVFEVADTTIRWNKLSDEDLSELDKFSSDNDKIDFTDGYTDIDVVYEIMLRQYGIPLSTPIDALSDVSDRTYMFNDSVVVCLDSKINNEIIERLSSIEPTPAKFVLRDSAFGDDIEFKDVSFRRLSALISNHQTEEEKKNKYNNYTVEFI